MATTKMIAPAGSASRVIQSEYGNYTVATDLTVTVDSRLVDELVGAGYTVFDVGGDSRLTDLETADTDADTRLDDLEGVDTATDSRLDDLEGVDTDTDTRLDALEALPLVMAGSHTVSAGEDTANTCDIVTGLGTVTSYTLSILRAGKDVTANAAVSEAAGTITVADNSTDYVLTDGDVINWIAVGTAA